MGVVTGPDEEARPDREARHAPLRPVLNDTEAALRASERRHRALFDLCRDGLFLFDGVGRVIEANRAGLELIGAESLDEVRGRLRSSLYPAAEREAAEAAFMRHLYAPHPAPLELDLQRQDGAAVAVEVSASLVPASDAVLTLVHYRDISERRRAARERQQLEERLRQSQKLEAIGRLAGGVAHDMNNVLGVIMGLASLLLDESPQDGDSAQRRGIQEILAASRRGRDLTQNLLRFARKDGCRREPLSLGALAAEVAEVLGRTLPKTIAIELRIDPDLPLVAGDPTQLHQALLNLCLNAVDAMPDGGVLSVQARAGDAALPRVELIIADTGVGMDPQTLERSFEPFFTTKLVGKGTGLGLTMVYGTVRAHGGDIAIESAPGRGTCVTLWLPAADAAEQAAPAPAPVEVASPTSLDEAAPRRTVLLVDDEPMVRNAARRLLVRLGYDVLAAESGAECLRLYQERKDAVWLVILDLSMPHMDGAEVLRHLQVLNPGARVLVCSGYSRDVSPEELLQAGALGYLRKPFEMQELASKLRQVERMG